MRIADFIRLHKEIMNLLSNYDVKMEDFKYIEMFEDYDSMVREGNKISYIVSYLSDKYRISEASVYRVLKRFKVTI